jgi:CRP/FNR family cyclic AMP-dependent transcriptional regulator
VSTAEFKPNVAKLFEDGETITYPKNQIILHATEVVEHMYRIVNGFVKVYTINSRGDEQVHVVYGPTDMFPLTSLLGAEPNSFFYQSITDCTVSRKSVSVIEEQLSKDVVLANAAMRQAVEQFKIFVTRVYSLEYRFARERLAHRLLVLAGRFGKRTEKGLVLQAPLTQQVIASSINLSRETVSREMERFVSKGYLQEISRSGKPMVILDPCGLATEIPGTPNFVSDPKDL